MSVVVIAGYGPGISHSVATLLGRQYKIALLSRTASKVEQAAQDFKKQGIEAYGFATDLSDTPTVKATLQKIQSTLGSIYILFYNGGGQPSTVLKAQVPDLERNLAINVTSLVVAAQTVQDDLIKNKGAILVTGGGFGADNLQITQYAVGLGVGTLCINKAAEHRTAAVLHQEFKPLGVYVGMVIVNVVVKGTLWDDGTATLEADKVAHSFETLLQQRTQFSIELN